MSGWFPNNFVEMFLGWPSFRLLQAMFICQKNTLHNSGERFQGHHGPLVFKLFCLSNKVRLKWKSNSLWVITRMNALYKLERVLLFLADLCIKNAQELLWSHFFCLLWFFINCLVNTLQAIFYLKNSWHFYQNIHLHQFLAKFETGSCEVNN